jgi:hypothetical protein
MGDDKDRGQTPVNEQEQQGSALHVNSGTGLPYPVNPETGEQYDEVTGLPIDPNTGKPVHEDQAKARSGQKTGRQEGEEPAKTR